MKLSESFLSVQGEGVTAGTPSYFIRLQGCNLLCGHNKSPHGDPNSSPTWICDTIAVWKYGKDISNEKMWEKIKQDGEAIGVNDLQDRILQGTTHLVWTGGEPTLARNRKGATEFLTFLDTNIRTLGFKRWESEWNQGPSNTDYDQRIGCVDQNGKEVRFKLRTFTNFDLHKESEQFVENLKTITSLKYDNKTESHHFLIGDRGFRCDIDDLHRPFYEIETNGTIGCPEFYGSMNQINCSPKLANSGMAKEARIVDEAIKQISQHPNHWWKFVIDCTTEQTALNDMSEIDNSFIIPFNLDKRRVILMPGVDNINDLPSVTRILFEISKKTGYRVVTRQHILAWNKTVGV